MRAGRDPGDRAIARSRLRPAGQRSRARRSPHPARRAAVAPRAGGAAAPSAGDAGGFTRSHRRAGRGLDQGVAARYRCRVPRSRAAVAWRARPVRTRLDHAARHARTDRGGRGHRRARRHTGSARIRRRSGGWEEPGRDRGLRTERPQAPCRIPARRRALGAGDAKSRPVSKTARKLRCAWPACATERSCPMRATPTRGGRGLCPRSPWRGTASMRVRRHPGWKLRPGRRGRDGGAGNARATACCWPCCKRLATNTHSGRDRQTAQT